MARADLPTVPGMADAVQARQRERGLRIGDIIKWTGLSREMVSRIRSGQRFNYRPDTTDAIAFILDWQPDWYERLLRGESPIEGPPPVSVRRAVLTRQAADVGHHYESLRSALAELPPIGE